jgi:hypothetical protein
MCGITGFTHTGSSFLPERIHEAVSTIVHRAAPWLRKHLLRKVLPLKSTEKTSRAESVEEASEECFTACHGRHHTPLFPPYSNKLSVLYTCNSNPGRNPTRQPSTNSPQHLSEKHLAFHISFAYYSPIGGERASTTRMRLAGKICCACRNPLDPDPAHPSGERYQ